MRSVSVMVAVVMCLASTARADEWFNAKTYSYEHGHIAVRFPRAPEVDSRTQDTDLGPVTANSAVLDDVSTRVQLLLMWTKYPSKRVWGTSKEELDAFGADLVSTTHGKVTVLKDLKVNGHPARQYKVVRDVDVSVVQIVLAKPWVYFQTARVPAMRAAEYPFGAFLSSLALK